MWRVKVHHLPATQLKFKPFPLHHLVSHQAVLSAASLPPFPTHAGRLAMTPPSSSTPFARAPATLLHPLTLTLAGRQTQATQLLSPLKQLGSVFFFPFSNQHRTTAATSSRASQLLPPSRLTSCTHLHLTCHSGEPFACTQATPLPPSCGTWPHLKTFR